MTMLSEEQLSSLSKEDLVKMMLKMQDSYSILEERIATMNVNTYGRKTEKLPMPEQMSMFNEFEVIEDGTEFEEEIPEEETETITYIRKKQKGKRETDLSAFPKVIVEHGYSDEELAEIFGDAGYKILPDQVYSKLEVKPAEYYVAEHHIKVYASKTGDRIVRAPHPAELLDNSIATPSLVAGILNAKYTNAMPLYRIEKELDRNGVNISRQNMANWAITSSDRYLSLVHSRMHEELVNGHVIQADETPAYVNKDGRPAGAKSQMWVYRTSEFEKDRPIILFNYASGRSSDYPMNFMKGFKGMLECDGFSGYRKIDRLDDHITVCCCWAHARRHFSNAVKAYGSKNPGVRNTLAYKALEKIGAIYKLEEKFVDLSAEERLKRRQTTVKKRVDEFFAWAKEHFDDTGKQDETYKGFAYCINNEEYLRRFLEDGNVPIDNSATERAIRPFTVFRKTWKMIDTPSGADASAIVYSIVETAKANNLKPYEYLKHLLTEIPKHMNDTNTSFVDDLLPWSEMLPEECRKKVNTK